MRKCCKSQLRNDRNSGTVPESSHVEWIVSLALVPSLPLQALLQDPLHLNRIHLH